MAIEPNAHFALGALGSIAITKAYEYLKQPTHMRVPETTYMYNRTTHRKTIQSSSKRSLPFSQKVDSMSRSSLHNYIGLDMLAA